VIARTAASQTKAELKIANTRIAELELDVDKLRGADVKLREVEEAAASERARADALYAQVGQLRADLERTSAELQEERARREELLKDLAYIQSQVADLASTRGELVSRVGQMTSREEKRRKTTAEFSDVLRTAEVVAADRLTSARRQQARAGKLEETVRALETEAEALRQKLQAAQTIAAMVAPLIKERDALKIDIAFFQKQIGAMQRAKVAAPTKKP